MFERKKKNPPYLHVCLLRAFFNPPVSLLCCGISAKLQPLTGVSNSVFLNGLSLLRIRHVSSLHCVGFYTQHRQTVTIV